MPKPAGGAITESLAQAGALTPQRATIPVSQPTTLDVPREVQALGQRAVDAYFRLVVQQAQPPEEARRWVLAAPDFRPEGTESTGAHEGGMIPGRRGTERTKRVLAGEYVVRPEAARRWRPLLEAVNRDEPDQVRKVALLLTNRRHTQVAR